MTPMLTQTEGCGNPKLTILVCLWLFQLRNDIEKAREVAAEIRKGNLQGFSIGGQAFKRVRKSDMENTEITKKLVKDGTT